MLEGVTVKKIPTTYHWYPVEGTEFSIAVAIPGGYQREVLRALPFPTGK